MKKALLLSVVASTMIMAGGDIEPVAVPVEVSNWEFGGQGVVYYQTIDEKDMLANGNEGLFKQTSSFANAGLQLRAVNKDLFWGFGAGGEVSGLATLGLENDVVSNVMQNTGRADLRGGWISQAYLTYGFGNTSIKGGRQELPKSLSPFAFSEGWNVFKNTFDAILLVNTDITNTTLVGAWVEGGNHNGIGAGTDMARFNKVNGGSGIYMATAAYSADALAVTGSYYFADNFADNNLGLNSGNDAHILWGDIAYGGIEGFKLAGQVGTVMDDDFTVANGFANDDNTIAWGLKAGGAWDNFDAALIYTAVNDGGLGLFNVGGVKTPLYSQLILNQDAIRADNSTFVGKAGLKTSFGKFGAAYNYSDLNSYARPGTALGGRGGAGTYSELDLTYKTKVFNDSTTLFAGYIYQKDERDAVVVNNVEVDAAEERSQNTVRVWGRYNF